MIVSILLFQKDPLRDLFSPLSEYFLHSFPTCRIVCPICIFPTGHTISLKERFNKKKWKKETFLQPEVQKAKQQTTYI